MKWIPVTERLPDKEGFYIVKQKGGYVTQLKFRPDVKRKEDDIWTFNILSEWLDESPSLPSSSVAGEEEKDLWNDALSFFLYEYARKPFDTKEEVITKLILTYKMTKR